MGKGKKASNNRSLHGGSNKEKVIHVEESKDGLSPPNKQSQSQQQNSKREQNQKLIEDQNDLLHASPIGISQSQFNPLADGLLKDVSVQKTLCEVEEEKSKNEKAKYSAHTQSSDSAMLIPHMVENNIYNYELLKGCIFVGHINTDLDSIAGAIGAAALYDGIPLAASEINSETEWALQKWGFETPLSVESYPDLHRYKVCLVDHNQVNQMHPKINPKQVVGIIDHHALQANTIKTANPIYMDIRPWGCMSTIIAKRFMKESKSIPMDIAGLLLSAILSDTLNFRSPTCTDMDKLIAVALSKIEKYDEKGQKTFRVVENGNIDALAKEQFKAKSKDLESHSIAELLLGDMKTFDFNAQIPSDRIWSGTFGWATIECVDYNSLLEKEEEIIKELNAAKRAMNMDMFFFSAVNIMEQESVVFIASELEREVVKESFKTTIDTDSIKKNAKFSSVNIGNLVSRKAQFVPGVIEAIGNPEWEPSKEAMDDSKTLKNQDFGILVYRDNNNGKLERFESNDDYVNELKDSNNPEKLANAKPLYALQPHTSMNWGTAINVNKFISNLKASVKKRKEEGNKEEEQENTKPMKTKKQLVRERKMMAVVGGLTLLTGLASVAVQMLRNRK